MADYYARRASEYERVYAKPERRADLQRIGQFLSGAFAGDTVLEVACGTAYWTRFIARSAAAVLATDCNCEVIDLARRKHFGACRVQFAQADAYVLDDIPYGHSSGFHGFWWSHVPIARINGFLAALHARLSPGAKVVMIDNVYVEGSSTPISRRDSDGNTYQMRTLEDGSEHEVLKNFPSEAELRESLSAHADDINVRFQQYYWISEYKTRQDVEPAAGDASPRA